MDAKTVVSDPPELEVGHEGRLKYEIERTSTGFKIGDEYQSREGKSERKYPGINVEKELRSKDDDARRNETPDRGAFSNQGAAVRYAETATLPSRPSCCSPFPISPSKYAASSPEKTSKLISTSAIVSASGLGIELLLSGAQNLIPGTPKQAARSASSSTQKNAKSLPTSPSKPAGESAKKSPSRSPSLKNTLSLLTSSTKAPGEKGKGSPSKSSDLKYTRLHPTSSNKTIGECKESPSRSPNVKYTQSLSLPTSPEQTEQKTKYSTEVGRFYAAVLKPFTFYKKSKETASLQPTDSKNCPTLESNNQGVSNTGAGSSGQHDGTRGCPTSPVSKNEHTGNPSVAESIAIGDQQNSTTPPPRVKIFQDSNAVRRSPVEAVASWSCPSSPTARASSPGMSSPSRTSLAEMSSPTSTSTWTGFSPSRTSPGAACSPIRTSPVARCSPTGSSMARKFPDSYIVTRRRTQEVAPFIQRRSKCSWDDCAVEFPSAGKLWAHVDTSHFSQCFWKSCRKQSLNEHAFLRHVWSHIAKVCHVCDQSWSEGLKLKNHCRRDHTINLRGDRFRILKFRSQQIDNIPDYTVCFWDKCTYLYNRQGMWEHLKDYHLTLPTKCLWAECGFETRHKLRLKSHVHGHVTGNAHDCFICRKIHPNEVDSKSHTLRHHEKQFRQYGTPTFECKTFIVTVPRPFDKLPTPSVYSARPAKEIVASSLIVSDTGEYASVYRSPTKQSYFTFDLPVSTVELPSDSKLVRPRSASSSAPKTNKLYTSQESSSNPVTPRIEPSETPLSDPVYSVTMLESPPEAGDSSSVVHSPKSDSSSSPVVVLSPTYNPPPMVLRSPIKLKRDKAPRFVRSDSSSSDEFYWPVKRLQSRGKYFV